MGQVFLEEARRILLTIDQAQSRVRAIAAGHQGVLRIALSGDIGRTRLAALLALCRQEAPQVSIQLSDVPFKELMHGLGADLFDAGFAVAGDVEDGIVAAPVWQAPLVVALPPWHPLRAFKEVPLAEVAAYPLILSDLQVRQACNRLRAARTQPAVAECVTTHTLMMTLVAAGYGVGFSSAAHLEGCHQADVVSRPLADQAAPLTTCLLRPEGDIDAPLRQFLARAERVGRQPPAQAQRTA